MTSQLSSPWHPGEIALQQQVDAEEKMAEIGRRFIRDHLIEQHRIFFSQLCYVLLGSVDSQGHVWATIRSGTPGFLHSPDPHALVAQIWRDPDDPADPGISQGQPIGLLGIELHSRRRNRLNGVVTRRDLHGFTLAVVQSFGNCPRYIHRRDAHVPDGNMSGSICRAVAVATNEPLVRGIVARADTFFVATYADIDGQGRQVDISHRGGPGGFIRLQDDGSMIIPDYNGNQYFNTLGNMLLNSKAGLVFPDFASGSLLQLTGDVDIDLTSDAIATFPGAERLWRFKPHSGVYRAGALPLRWKMRDGETPASG